MIFQHRLIGFLARLLGFLSRPAGLLCQPLGLQVQPRRFLCRPSGFHGRRAGLRCRPSKFLWRPVGFHSYRADCSFTAGIAILPARLSAILTIGQIGTPGEGTRPTRGRFCGGCRPGAPTRRGGDRAMILERAVQPQMDTDGHGFTWAFASAPLLPKGAALANGIFICVHLCLSVV